MESEEIPRYHAAGHTKMLDQVAVFALQRT